MNEQERLARLYRSYGTELQRLCYLYLKDYHLAEDVVSETYLRAFRKLPDFRGEASERTWLTRIAINVCKNKLRSPAYRELAVETLPEGALSCAQASAAEQGEEQIERILISREIMALPVKYREAVLLHYYQELTVKEMAQLLRPPTTTVAGRLKRARKLLKERLKEEYFDET